MRAAWAGFSVGILFFKNQIPTVSPRIPETLQSHAFTSSPTLLHPPHTHTHTKAKGEGAKFQAALTEIKTKEAAMFLKCHSAHKDEDFRAGSRAAIYF